MECHVTPCIWWSALNPHENKYPIILSASLSHPPRDFTVILSKRKYSEDKLNYCLNIYHKEVIGDVAQASNLIRAIEQCQKSKSNRTSKTKLSKVISFDLNLRSIQIKNYFVGIDKRIETYLNHAMYKFSVPTESLIPINVINTFVIELYKEVPELYNITYFQTVSLRRPTYDSDQE